MNTGWWPNPPKKCIRCGGEVSTPLYALCDVCHDKDILDVHFGKSLLERTDEAIAEAKETLAQVRPE